MTEPKKINDELLESFYATDNLISNDESWIKFRHLWNKFNPKTG